MESMNIIINAASSIASTISDKLIQRPSSPVVTRMDVVAQEEAERNIREIHPAQARLRMDNAKRVSSMVSGGPHAFAVQPLKGFRAITNKLEEVERQRRINTKAEYALRRSNAAKVAGIVKSLGWPFYHHDLHKGTKIIIISPSILAEEEERQRRVSDPFSIMTAKHNAAIVSSLVRWHGPSRPATARRYTRMLEEKERKQRATDAEHASANAMKVSQLIRNIGFPFYKGEIYQAASWTNTHVLEEKERDRRMASGAEQQLARETAGEIARMLPTPTYRLNDLEEKERARRMRIHNGENARAEAQLIQRALIDESISGAHARRLAGLAAPVRNIDGLRFNKQSIIAQEERERERRIKDPSGQIRAMNLARSASRVIAASFSTDPAAPLSPVETERQRRMYDRKGKLTSMRNARAVAAMIANRPQIPLRSVPAPSRRPLSPVEEEEMERDRRVRDVSGQMLARSNAMQVSGLVIGSQKKRSLLQHSNSESAIQRPAILSVPASRLPAATPMTLPASPMPFSPMVESHELPKTPVVTFQPCPEMVLTPSLPAPVIKKLAASIQQTAVDPSSVSALGTRAPPGFGAIPAHAPRANRSLQHSSSEPNLVGRVAPSPTTAQRAIPMSSALFSRVPIVGAPVPAGSAATTCGDYKYVTPVYPPAYTHAGQPVRSALRNASISAPSGPHSSPTHSVSFAPLPERVTPTIVYDKPYTFPAPSYAAASAAPLSMGAYPPPKGFKKLEKTAVKHQKLADKAARRSAKDQAKAEKLHLKGKDMRAVRYQTKAEQSAAAAAHHSAYAQEYKKDIYAPAPLAPASAPGLLAAGSPMM